MSSARIRQAAIVPRAWVRVGISAEDGGPLARGFLEEFAQTRSGTHPSAIECWLEYLCEWQRLYQISLKSCGCGNVLFWVGTSFIR